MPYSKNQKIAAAIAKNHPEKLHAENRGMLSMSRSELDDMSSGSIKKSKIGAALAKTKKDPIDL